MPVADDHISYGDWQSGHYYADVEILGRTISGDTAYEKIDALSQIAIEHNESLDNLPVFIIRTLADDNLTDSKTAAIRAAWRAMEPKELLGFLQAYAISDLFHSPSRIKYLPSIDRNLIVLNRILLDNKASYRNIYPTRSLMDAEDVEAFWPTHDVFGTQTGAEAAQSPDIFRVIYNRSVEGWTYGATSRDGWQKEWSRVIKAKTGSLYVVQDVAAWLWQRFIADGLKHFGPLEKAHLYAILATGRDLAVALADCDTDSSRCEDNATVNRVITETELLSDAQIKEQIDGFAIAPLLLESSDADEREEANTRINRAIHFIIATPYMMIQEGV